MSNILLNSLKEFYEIPYNKLKLFDIVNNTNNISLRIIDWFVTNFSKKQNIIYDINTLQNTPDSNNLFNVYINYKLQLKGYSKKQFDPFCRLHGSPGISFYYNEKESFDTTIGQLNFFKWVISNNIIDYISANIDIIEKDMNTCYQKQYKSIDNEKKKIKTRRKRKELSISASKSLTKSNVKVLVSFD